MSLLAALLLTGSVAADPPARKPPASATVIALARIIAPAEVRRIDGRLQIVAGDRHAPTQVHRTERHDGGETADFY